jgi:hypothetical protein
MISKLIQCTEQNKLTIATIQPTTQNKTKQLGCCGIIIGKKTTTTPPPPHWNDYIFCH